jgi:hypothetical protein
MLRLRKRDVDPALRDAYEIAARFEARFVEVFVTAVRRVMTPAVERELLQAIRSRSTQAVLDAFPSAVWGSMTEPMMEIYGEVVSAGAAEAFGAFAVQKEPFNIDPFQVAAEWIRERSGKLIRHISDNQRESVTQLLARGFERGERPEAILDQIGATVGLTVREAVAVDRRLEHAIESGVPEAKAREDSERYASRLLNQRAMRIARTETVEAQSQGRFGAWQEANDRGLLEQGTVRQWVSAGEPRRTCPICLGLDAKTAPVDKPYESDIAGEVMRPPAHPSCRCTEILVFPGDTPLAPENLSPLPRPRRGSELVVPSTSPPEPRPTVNTRSGRRVDLSPQQMEAEQSARWLRTNAQARDRASVEERREWLLWEWVHGTERNTSLLLKAAAQSMGATGPISRRGRAPVFDAKTLRRAREDLERMRQETLAELKRRGITHVTVFRGELSAAAPGRKDLALSSWSTDRSIAERFAKRSPAGVVREVKVPIERIAFGHVTPGWVDGIHGHQAELVLFSDPL